MKKSIKTFGFLIGLLFVLNLWLSTGCNRTPMLPSPLATPTPSSPTCVWTPLSSGVNGTYNSNGNMVIHNSTDWTSFDNGLGLIFPIPTPSVNFSTQMVLAVSEGFPSACTCNSGGPTITSVCAYSDHIEVDYQEIPPPAGCLQPTPVINICAFHVVSESGLAAAPQSSLPVSWIYKPFPPTPTPTP